MVLQKYEYKDTPPIITIPKCGIRFVRNSDWINLSEVNIYLDSNQSFDNITQDTIVTYRNPHEHIISAIQTDYVWGNIEGRFHCDDNRIYGWDLDTIVQNMIDDKSEHWSPNLYKNLYRIWNIFGFKMIHLSKLSELFDYKIEYKPESYNSHQMEHFKSKVEILSMISKDKLDELYSLCDKDELWLKRILNNERGLTSYELLMKKQNEIDKLNDDILDIKNNSKLIQKKLNDDILNLKTKLKHIKRELI
jgi:hypothetical protein